MKHNEFLNLIINIWSRHESPNKATSNEY